MAPEESIHARVWAAWTLTPSEKLVALFISHQCHLEAGQATIKNQQLVDVTGLTRRSVFAALKVLRDRCVIARQPVPGKPSVFTMFPAVPQ